MRALAPIADSAGGGVNLPAKKPALKPAKAPRHDSGELVIIAGSAVMPGMPNDEGGPRVWSRRFFSDGRLTATRVGQVAILQLAKNPTHRPILHHRHRAVFVLSDATYSARGKLATAGNECRAVGTFTEACRLAQRVKWIPLRRWFTGAEITTLAVREIQLAREDDTALRARDVLLLLWKTNPTSFGGAAMGEIGRDICDTAFTLGTDTIPAFLDRDDDEELDPWTDE